MRLNTPRDGARRGTVEAFGAELDQRRLQQRLPDIGPESAVADLGGRFGLAQHQTKRTVLSTDNTGR